MNAGISTFNQECNGSQPKQSQIFTPKNLPETFLKSFCNSHYIRKSSCKYIVDFQQQILIESNLIILTYQFSKDTLHVNNKIKLIPEHASMTFNSEYQNPLLCKGLTMYY